MNNDKDLLKDACLRMRKGQGTPDDCLRFYQFLSVQLMDVPSRHAESGALQELNGRRNFASELMALFKEVPNAGGSAVSRGSDHASVNDAGGPRVDRSNRQRGTVRRVKPGSDEA